MGGINYHARDARRPIYRFLSTDHQRRLDLHPGLQPNPDEVGARAARLHLWPYAAGRFRVEHSPLARRAPGPFWLLRRPDLHPSRLVDRADDGCLARAPSVRGRIAGRALEPALEQTVDLHKSHPLRLL